MLEVLRAFVISDILSSSARHEMSSAMIYENETMPLLADVGLKFGRADG